jgi:hypothetical protein
MEVSSTNISLIDEVFVAIKIHASSWTHQLCAFQLWYEDVQAQNGEQFVGYNQNISIEVNQTLFMSMPAFPLFPVSQTVTQVRPLSWLARISPTACNWNLSGSSHSLVYLDESHINSSIHDVITCFFTTSLTKKELISHLLNIKEGLAKLLGIPRKDVLLGRIGLSLVQRRVASPGGAVLPIKVLVRKGEGNSLIQKLSSADFGSFIPQPVNGSLGDIILVSRLEPLISLHVQLCHVTCLD